MKTTKETLLKISHAVGDFLLKASNQIDPASHHGLNNQIEYCRKNITNIVDKYGRDLINAVESETQLIEKNLYQGKELDKHIDKLVQLIRQYQEKMVPKISAEIKKNSNEYVQQILSFQSQKFGLKKIPLLERHIEIFDNLNKWDETFLNNYYDEIIGRTKATFSKDGKYYTLMKSYKDLQDLYKADSNKSFTSIADIAKYTAGGNYLDLSVDAVMGRSRSVSSGCSYQAIGISRIKIVAVLDTRTSDICWNMDGTIYETSNVVDYYANLGQQRSVDGYLASNKWLNYNKENGLHIKDGNNITPIQRGQSSKDVSVAGVCMPPYHGRCRTVTDIDYSESPVVIGGGQPLPQRPTRVSYVPTEVREKPRYVHGKEIELAEKRVKLSKSTENILDKHMMS